MRIWVSGAAGFIGRATVAALRARRDDVVAVVRDPARAEHLIGRGVELVTDDLSSTDRLAVSLAGCDGAIHLAGSYRVGIRPAERPQMYDANVAAVERVLDAATTSGVPRIVHVSTINHSATAAGEFLTRRIGGIPPTAS